MVRQLPFMQKRNKILLSRKIKSSDQIIKIKDPLQQLQRIFYLKICTAPSLLGLEDLVPESWHQDKFGVPGETDEKNGTVGSK